jgi:hypothetical protein
MSRRASIGRRRAHGLSEGGAGEAEDGDSSEKDFADHERFSRTNLNVAPGPFGRRDLG